MKIRIFSCFLLITTAFSAIAQLSVLSVKQDTLFYLDDSHILSANQEDTLYSTQGNILFSGNSTNYKKILFSLAIDSLNQRKKALVYGNKGNNTRYSIQENKLFFTLKGEDEAIIQFVKTTETWAAYNLLTDSLLFYIPSINLTPAQLFGVSYAYMNSTNYIQEVKEQLSEQISYSVAAIIPTNHNGITWIWDGLLLYPYGASIHSNLVWSFDGEKLMPRNFARSQEEWSWDGTTLKPMWGGNPTYFWSWQNGVLRQVWNNDHRSEYMIYKGILRKRFSNFGDPEWEIQGDIPLAIITAVALRILYR